jgi:hypothetical protein
MKKIFIVTFLVITFLVFKLYFYGSTKSVVYAQNLPYGNYLVFDGGYLSASSTGQSSPTNFSFEAWIKPSSIKSYRRILSIGDNVNGSMHYEVGINGGLLSFNYIYGPYSSRLIASGQIPLNVWSHIAVTVSSLSTKLFIDGTQIYSTSGGSPLPNIGSNIVLGASHLKSLNSTNAYLGFMDEVRLSTSERNINSLWDSGTYQKPLFPDQYTILLWNMDNYKGQKIANDSSGNSIFGYLSGWDSQIFFDGNMPIPTLTPSSTPTPRWTDNIWKRPVLPTLPGINPISSPAPTNNAPQVTSAPSPIPTASGRFSVPTPFYRR